MGDAAGGEVLLHETVISIVVLFDFSRKKCCAYPSGWLKYGHLAQCHAGVQSECVWHSHYPESIQRTCFFI